MGNQPSSSKRKGRGETAAEKVKQVVGDAAKEIQRSVRKLDDDHPAAQFIDSVCGGGYYDDEASGRYRHHGRSSSFYSEGDYSEDGSRTVSEDDRTYEDDRSRRSRMDKSIETQSYASQSEYSKRRSFDTEDESRADTTGGNPSAALQKQPLASSFAKRCYFTKAGIDRTTQHYEGLTLNGNVVLMLASAMKLKGCPTICDEDLRRVEQTYPNQFSRLPDELLLSSGWRRVSKYCHFSNKAIPDGIPFFHSKQRLHPSGGYYFLLAAAIGMTRPMDVEPLSRDTLVLLETDYPTQCDSAPSLLIKDPDQWTLVNKFCFFSGGPINTEEDVYYQADFDGNAIYMLAFLSPSLTPEELYKLGEPGEPTLNTLQAVQEVESVYDLTDRDFDDLKLYHLGPCRALPQFILTPQAWTKILPPHFLAARQQAMIRAEDFMQRHGIPHTPMAHNLGPNYDIDTGFVTDEVAAGDTMSPGLAAEFQREIEEEGAFHGSPSIPIDEPDEPGALAPHHRLYDDPKTPKLDPPEDPPEDEPPRLHRGIPDPYLPSLVARKADPSVHDRTFYQTLHTEATQEAASSSSKPVVVGSTVEEAPAHGPFSDQPQDEVAAAKQDSRPPPQSLDPFQPGSTPKGHHPMSPPHEDDTMYNGEEKKLAMGEDDYRSEAGMKSGEEDFIPMKHNTYHLANEPELAKSPQSVTSDGGSHASAALRGAQEILKKNRRRKLEMASQDPGTPQIASPGVGDGDTWESGSELSGSNVSGSSVWSTDSGNGGDRTSRRALILQMAKARMRNNKESPVKVSNSVAASTGRATIMEEDTESVGDQTDINAAIDFAQDLD